ncbi:MAG: Response regulator receiver protein [uncultured bacterium]|nr:MAG: Response regulator receiver protein [uncultured bacterium]HBY01376.1 two-component system response regulator [Rikenellaceae bacterium]
MKTEIKRILIVDDSQNDVELTKAVLIQNNLANEITVAEDGEEALDYLYKRGKFANEKTNPAIILLDMKMPKMNGIEVLKIIRNDCQFSAVPIIIFTSSREERDLVESYRNGANSYVVKPVDIPQFIDAIKSLGQYWIVVNQQPNMLP